MKNIEKIINDIQDSKIRLYVFYNVIKNEYFDTEDELLKWLRSNNNLEGNSCIVEYLGELFGRSDVIRITYYNAPAKYVVATSEDSYDIFNEQRSYLQNEYIWEYNKGDLRDIYKELKNRGIVFQNNAFVESKKRKLDVYNNYHEIKHYYKY